MTDPFAAPDMSTQSAQVLMQSESESITIELGICTESGCEYRARLTRAGQPETYGGWHSSPATAVDSLWGKVNFR